MSPDMHDEPVKEKAEDMDKDASRMEGKLEKVEEDIDEAKSASKLTAEQADPPTGDPMADTAGDWEDTARTDQDPSGADEQEPPSGDEDGEEDEG